VSESGPDSESVASESATSEDRVLVGEIVESSDTGRDVKSGVSVMHLAQELRHVQVQTQCLWMDCPQFSCHHVVSHPG
jgi:hypothetical protein